MKTDINIMIAKRIGLEPLQPLLAAPLTSVQVAINKLAKVRNVESN